MTQLTTRGAETRSKILRAASDVVHDEGVAGFTVDLVCGRAGVSKSQLYHFFASRDQLLEAVAASTVEAVLDLQSELFADLTSLDGFRAWAAALVQLQIDRGAEGGCPIGSLHSQFDEKQAGAQSLLRHGFDQWSEALRHGLEEMKRRGSLPDAYDAEEQARLFLVALQGGLLLTDAYRDHTWLEAALDERLRALEAALSR